MGELLGSADGDRQPHRRGRHRSAAASWRTPSRTVTRCSAAATASQIIGPQIYKSVITYDPFRDFQPISLFAITTNVLVVNPGTPFKSVKELVAYAKANPGKIRWSNAGSGFQSHLAGVLFTHMAGIDVLHVPYKGAGPSLNAAIAGESQVTFVPAPSVMAHVRGGRLRALAVGGEKRSEVAPELPTVIESGVPGFVSSGWAGLIAGSRVLGLDRPQATTRRCTGGQRSGDQRRA